MFKSKYGYHSCSLETYKKLKKLNAAIYEAERQMGKWARWHKKAPHNRVFRRKIRDEVGRVIGYEPPVPVDEPQLNMFIDKCQSETNWVNGVYNKTPVKVDYLTLNVLYSNVRNDFHIAKHPFEEADKVSKLILSEEKIEELYRRLT